VLCDRHAVAQVTARHATPMTLCRHHYRRMLADREYYECMGYSFDDDPARLGGARCNLEIEVAHAALAIGTA